MIEQGYMWVDESAIEITQTRAKLLYAHYNYIINNDGKYQPCQPLLLYKHYLQVQYTQGKPDLDKNT